jgi:hypothetical protein
MMELVARIEVHMLDAAFIALTIVFFIAGWAFTRACDRL